MLNWLLRYVPVVADVDPAVGVLEVGCGRLGLGSVYNGARFAGQDLDFDGPVSAAVFAVRTAPERFPWADGAFDTVICVDLLERLAPPARAALVAECARVAARRVLIACPTTATDGSVEFFSDLYRSAVVDPPRMRLPLPDPAEVESWCRRVAGFTVKPWAQVNGLLAELVLVGDLHPQFAVGAAEEYADRRGGWIRALQGARFGDGVLRGFELLRTEPRAPLVDTKRFDASTAAALECVRCRTRLRLETAVGLRCVGCGRIPARDAGGTWDLTGA